MTLREELEAIEGQLTALYVRRKEIYQQSIAAPESEKVCPDWIAESGDTGFAYPIEVAGIANGETDAVHYRRDVGAFVAVRPVGKEYGGKTFLGIYVGDVASDVDCRFHRTTGILSIALGMHNPAIYVPDLKRIVFGYESWWAKLESPEDLRQISDKDIENVWYVKALRDLGGNS